MMDDDYFIHIHSFDGPFSLLLELIKKKKMDIYNLPISEITQDYLAKLNEMKENKIEVTSDFMDMASTLLAIKTKTILAKNEEEISQVKNEFVQQLIDFQDYKKTQEHLESLLEIENKIFHRKRKEFIPKQKQNKLQELKEAFRKMLQNNMITKERTDRFSIFSQQMGQFKYTIEGQMDFLRNDIRDEGVNAVDFLSRFENREHLIVTFSALLELIKLDEVLLILEEDKIWIKKVI